MKKILKFSILFFILFFIVVISFGESKAYELTGLVIDGSKVYYRGTSTQVQTPDTYEKRKFDMRAMWVTPISGDIRINNEVNFRTELEEVFETMKYFNLNTLVFHVRSHNDAYYPSKLNPKSTRVLNIDFDTFDPLEWVVKRCHEEGYEFHAWLNPYRAMAMPADYYPDTNPAKNPANLLKTNDGTKEGLILNPGIPLVRDFLVDTCMEIIENYDIDAIHFDDYFYADGINDNATYSVYNPKGLGIADWRREQVDMFIEDLSNTMRAYNQANNRHVQLGVAPTGVYRTVNTRAQAINGTYDDAGTYSAVGSNNSGCFSHYGSYLYADTKKWVDNEWLDYIAPQTYWGFKPKTVGHFADLVEWWSLATAKKKVNLYAAMGIYMAEGSWQTNMYEAPMQVTYTSQFESVKGTFIYKYGELKTAKNGGLTTNAINANNLHELWDYPSLIPEIRTMAPVSLGEVNNFKVEENKLSWDILDNAKRYAIYRSETDTVNQTVSELLTVVGNKTKYFVDETYDASKDYTYAITAISGTNTEGKLTYPSSGKVVIPVIDDLEIDVVYGRPTLIWKNNNLAEVDSFKLKVNNNYLLDIKDVLNSYDISYLLKAGNNNITLKAYKGSLEKNSLTLTYTTTKASIYALNDIEVEVETDPDTFVDSYYLKWELGMPEESLKEIKVFVEDDLVETIIGSNLEFDITDFLIDGINTISLEVMDIYDNLVYDNYILYEYKSSEDTSLPESATPKKGCKATAVNLFFLFVGFGIIFIKRKESM